MPYICNDCGLELDFCRCVTPIGSGSVQSMLAVKEGPSPLPRTKSSQSMKAVTLDTELHNKVRSLVKEIQSDLALLNKSLDLPGDNWSLKIRAAAIRDRAEKLMQIAAKLDILQEIKSDL